MPNPSRKRRGRETEHIVTERLQQVWPTARVVNSGASGSDVVDIPVFVEVKARKDFKPKEYLDSIKKRSKGKMGFAVLRLNGQGEAAVDEFAAVIRFGDLIELLSRYYPKGEYNKIDRCGECGAWAIVGRDCDVCTLLKSRSRQI